MGAKPTEVKIEVNGQEKTLTGDELNAWKYQRYMQDYLACVQSVDDSVGQLMDLLKAEGLDRNTIVIYTSDNGFFLGDHGCYDKRFMYEETLRIPFIVRWPDVAKAGTREKAMAINTDFAPTFLDAASKGSRRHAGPQPGAAAQGRASRQLAEELLLPLLPRSRRSQHGAPSRRAH